MSVAETSMQALQKKLEEGSCKTDRDKCEAIIKELGPITMEEMEMYMKKPKSAFSGRVKKLKELNKVEIVGKKNGHQLLNTVEKSDVEKEWVSIDHEHNEEDVDDLFIEEEEDEKVIWG